MIHFTNTSFVYILNHLKNDYEKGILHSHRIPAVINKKNQPHGAINANNVHVNPEPQNMEHSCFKLHEVFAVAEQ